MTILAARQERSPRCSSQHRSQQNRSQLANPELTERAMSRHPSAVATQLLEPADPAVYDVRTNAPGPQGKLAADRRNAAHSPQRRPVRPDAKRRDGVEARGHAGAAVSDCSARREGFARRTARRLRSGYHTGHWEVGLLVQAAAREIKATGGVAVRRVCQRSRATAARRERPACSTACRIATTPRSSCDG